MPKKIHLKCSKRAQITNIDLVCKKPDIYFFKKCQIKDKVLFCCGRAPASVGKGKPDISDAVEHLTKNFNCWQQMAKSLQRICAVSFARLLP